MERRRIGHFGRSLMLPCFELETAVQSRQPWAPRRVRRPLFVCIAVAACFVFASSVYGQILAKDESGSGPRYGEAKVKLFRVGAEIEAARGDCRDVLALVAVPWQCAEQDVRIVDQDVSPEVRQLTYRDLDSGEVRQMVIQVPFLAAGTTARAIVTFEVSTRPVLPPETTDSLVIPEKLPSDLRPYIGASPLIESRHRKVRAVAEEIFRDVDEQAPAWEQVEAIYDYVQGHVEYVEGRDDQSAAATLEEGKGDCHALTVAFIALCRARQIPSRMVWVEDHCYPEFYLADAQGNGHWYPCQSAGDRAFGEMPDPRVIFQKGDNFRIPERRGERLRYASDWARFLAAPKGQPRIRYVREQR
jgi:hypothetical protein